MEITTEIPEYSSAHGITYKWIDGFEIATIVDQGKVLILANKEGLISLAGHLLNLAQDEIPNGHHMHFDAYNSLEDGSIDLIIEKRL